MKQYLENTINTIWATLLVRAPGRLTGRSVATAQVFGSSLPVSATSRPRTVCLLRGNSGTRFNPVSVLLVLLLVPGVSMAGTVYFYTPQSVGNISGRAYADGDAPLHWLNMSTFGETSSAVSQTISGWNVGDFSGVVSPSPVGSYQLGINNSAYGSAAVQMTDTAVGAQVNTFTIPGGSSYNNNLANAQVQYKWSAADNLTPWAYSTSNFNFSFYLEVPSSYFTGGAVGYVMSSILVSDENNHSLWIQASAYDVRGVGSSGIHEYIGFDPGTDTAFADSFYDPNKTTRYLSESANSNSSTGSTWSGLRWYGYSINRTQLLNAINDANSKYGIGLSTNPANYTLRFISIQDEIAWPSGNGWLPFGADQIWAYETY
jgi:hypothetical protein